MYDLISTIPQGSVTTYKDVARKLGTTGYRAVGQALRCNPFAPRVPCHRVVASDGSLGGFQGARGGAALQKKIALLRHEGIRIVDGKVVDFGERRYTF